MCTAISYRTNNSYFGRTLDLEYSYLESVTVMPRDYRISLRSGSEITSHYAIIGTAFVKDNYPLYYDAGNESGLAIAGLNFPGNAVYNEVKAGMTNIASFELIPYILSKCKNVSEAKRELAKINITAEPFSGELPPSPLHWMLSDMREAIVVEQTSEGLHIYDNPMCVMTNNPPFNIMQNYLLDYRHLTAGVSESRFSDTVEFPEYCAGMGAIGLPGDFSSASRFVKASFVRANARSKRPDGEDFSEGESVSEFFHIIGSVEMPRGSVRLASGRDDITVYTSCFNQSLGVYYYTTYVNPRISAVDMRKEKLDSCELISYPMIKGNDILYQN